jgi:hypothetical protein
MSLGCLAGDRSPGTTHSAVCRWSACPGKISDLATLRSTWSTINNHMLRFWKGLKPKPQLSRSRPYRKNDGRFVEQKNSTLVRSYLGCGRLDTIAQTLAVNELYDKMWFYYDFFQSVMRLTEKKWVGENGQPSWLKRVYSKAPDAFRPPLCYHGYLTRTEREA